MNRSSLPDKPNGASHYRPVTDLLADRPALKGSINFDQRTRKPKQKRETKVALPTRAETLHTRKGAKILDVSARGVIVLVFTEGGELKVLRLSPQQICVARRALRSLIDQGQAHEQLREDGPL